MGTRKAASTAIMPTLAHLLAPLALLLAPSQSAPVALRDSAGGAGADALFGGVDQAAESADEAVWSLALRVSGPPMLPADQTDPGALEPETWNQVRIEQHLTIRISPGQAPRGTFFAPPPPPPATPQRAPERRQIRCVAMAALGGLRLSGPNQLTLILRDDRMIQATLPKICSASAFYSGFYVEPTSDGMLCARRDVIHSRAGSNCSISRLDAVDWGN